MQTHLVLPEPQGDHPGTSIARRLILLCILAVCTLVITGCGPSQSDQAVSTHPACVTLPMYSSVIDQVMNMQPTWDPLPQIKDGYQYQWTLQEDRAKHTLSATLTSEGCVCAATAASHYSLGDNQEKLVGLLQGAAVAPVSNLDYTAGWLEPRILFPCTLAFALRRPYEAKSLMEDGTTWQLTCSRSRNGEVDESMTQLTIVAPSCAAIVNE